MALINVCIYTYYVSLYIRRLKWLTCRYYTILIWGLLCSLRYVYVCMYIYIHSHEIVLSPTTCLYTCLHVVDADVVYFQNPIQTWTIVHVGLY